MDVYHGFDLSFSDLTDQAAQSLFHEGHRLMSQCLWTGNAQPAPRTTNLRVGSFVFPRLMGYVSLTPSLSGAQHVVKAFAGMPADLRSRLDDVAIDVEIEGVTFEQVEEAVETVAGLGWRKLIYTSAGYWLEHMRNEPAPAGWLLWDARWDGNADIDDPIQGYGGFDAARVVGHQYSGNVNVHGVDIDLDVWNPALMPLLRRDPNQLPLPLTSRLDDVIRQLQEIRGSLPEP